MGEKHNGTPLIQKRSIQKEKKQWQTEAKKPPPPPDTGIKHRSQVETSGGKGRKIGLDKRPQNQSTERKQTQINKTTRQDLHPNTTTERDDPNGRSTKRWPKKSMEGHTARVKATTKPATPQDTNRSAEKQNYVV